MTDQDQDPEKIARMRGAHNRGWAAAKAGKPHTDNPHAGEGGDPWLALEWRIAWDEGRGAARRAMRNVAAFARKVWEGDGS